MKKKILVISGPNINLLEKRKVSKYGEYSLEDIHNELKAEAEALDVEVECYQFNNEGDIITCLQKENGEFAGVIINAAALSQYSLALRSAVGTLQVPCIEVLISNVHAQEEDFRKTSVIAPVCTGVIEGFGKDSYTLALKALVNLVNK